MEQRLGLLSTEASRYLSQYGLNELPSKKPASVFALLLSQSKNILTLILALAAVLSLFIGDKVDAILIMIILLLNTFLGFWQEYKASKELEALKKLEIIYSRVIRDGKEQEVSARKLVPGDIVVLDAGSNIPADGILIKSATLTVNEASLTGESVPVLKTTKEGENELFFGTSIISGHGLIKISNTGKNTKFGKIALTLAEVVEEPTPLEIAISSLGKKLAIVAVAASALVFILGFIKNPLVLTHAKDLLELFFTSTALAVAAVPEGLPTIITIILAIGIRRLYHRKTLVRKMASVESLGASSVICTDKTGTITKNEMSVQETYVAKEDLADALKASIIVNSASLVLKEDHGQFDILGDTTEGALLVWAKDNDLDIEAVRSSGKLLDEKPFDLNSRMMSVVWEDKHTKTLMVKGAPEKILSFCSLSDESLSKLDKVYQSMAIKGLRVMGFAKKQVDSLNYRMENLTFLGFVGIADSPRLEVKGAVAKAKKAGIKVVMVTGDNELTAKAIAEQVGLLSEGDEVLLGSQLDMLTEEKLEEALDKVRIFARCVPEHKLRIVKAFQRKGEVVAVTGDGVNDVLALKQAHIGVGMGKIGTDAAKEASDIVLLDDNFATIINAVEQGRLIYRNIVKVVKFLIAGNSSEILLIVLASLIGLPSPLLPVQILWINFVTDGLPALSLAADEHYRYALEKPSRQNNNFLSRDNLWFIATGGVAMGVITLASFILTFGYGLATARTVAFTTLVVVQMVFIFIVRREEPLFSNKYLIASVGLIFLAQGLILTVPFLQDLFKVSLAF